MVCVKLSLIPSSIPHHYPAPVPVSNPVPDPVSKPEPVLETQSETEPIAVSAQPQLEPKYPSPPNLELNLESVNEPLLEPTIVPSARSQKPQSQPSVDFTYSFDQTPVSTPTSQVNSSGQMMVTAQEQSQSVPLFEPQHLGSSDLLLRPQSAAAMVPQESLPSCAQTQSVPVSQQASGAVHSGPVLPAEPLESVQEPTVDLQQPASDEMPPSSSSQPLAALGLSPDILPQEAMSLQTPVDSQPPAPESDLMTQRPVFETDLLNTSDCRPVLYVEEVSGCGDPNKSRDKEAATLEEVPCPCPAMLLLEPPVAASLCDRIVTV